MRSNDTCIINIDEEGAAFAYLWFRNQTNPLDLQIDYETQVTCSTVDPADGGSTRVVAGPRIKPGVERKVEYHETLEEFEEIVG